MLNQIAFAPMGLVPTMSCSRTAPVNNVPMFSDALCYSFALGLVKPPLSQGLPHLALLSPVNRGHQKTWLGAPSCLYRGPKDPQRAMYLTLILCFRTWLGKTTFRTFIIPAGERLSAVFQHLK